MQGNILTYESFIPEVVSSWFTFRFILPLFVSRDFCHFYSEERLLPQYFRIKNDDQFFRKLNALEVHTMP